MLFVAYAIAVKLRSVTEERRGLHDQRENGVIIVTQTSRHAVVFLERGSPATAAVRTEAKPCGGLCVRRDLSALCRALSPVDNGDWPGRGLGFIPAACLPTALPFTLRSPSRGHWGNFCAGATCLPSFSCHQLERCVYVRFPFPRA